MNIARMDLDGSTSPTVLVTKILKAEPNMSVPVPIESLAEQLDIDEIREVATQGFEGGLITDSSRSRGIILVNREARGGRRRFTIGHELGHFLMPHHKPPKDGFVCSRADMARWDGREKSETVGFEVEANQFASLILMPPPLWRKALERHREPGLEHIVDLASEFGVSKEASARSYVLYRYEQIAIVAVKDGVIAKIYRKPTGFPALCVSKHDPVPRVSRLFRERQRGHATEFDETAAAQWLKSDWGRPLPDLYEQVLVQRDGYALIMLWAESPEEEEERDLDDDRTSKQRYQNCLARWQERR